MSTLSIPTFSSRAFRAGSFLFVVATLALVLAACSERADDSARERATETPRSTEQHATAGAAVGSYDDWCAEHAVPESQCTRCDPALAAAFKATGDWCKEHGLPESQCVACDPSRKPTRPPKGTQ